MLIADLLKIDSGFGSTLGEILDDWDSFADGWFRRKAEQRNSKPNVIEEKYFKGQIDIDEMDTLMGASMGVTKDQERLRHLRELEQ